MGRRVRISAVGAGFWGCSLVEFLRSRALIGMSVGLAPEVTSVLTQVVPGLPRRQNC
jgi:hypothetical protein